MHPPASLSAETATQQPTSQPVDMDDHIPLGFPAFVTVCAFNPSCFLINVSMSTSIFLSRDVNSIPPKDWMFSGFTPSRPPRQHAAFKTLQLQLHFWDSSRALIAETGALSRNESAFCASNGRTSSRNSASSGQGD